MGGWITAAVLTVALGLPSCLGSGPVAQEAVAQEAHLIAADLRGASTLIEDPALTEALLMAAQVLEGFDGDMSEAQAALSAARTLAEGYLHGSDRVAVMSAIIVAQSALRRWEAY